MSPLVLALPFLLCAMISSGARAAETPALKILRNIQNLQGRHAFLAPELLPPLVELGQRYGAGQCDRAIDILDLALEVSRRNEGLFNTGQLDIYAPLLNCYVTLDRPVELQRAQQLALLIEERHYGRDDVQLLPGLEQAARRYEEVGLYLSARILHRRALDIARHNAGENDPSLVKPLRGIARAFRLEYAYGLAMPDAATRYEAPDMVSHATLDGTDRRLDKLGQRSLERAVAILKSHPHANHDEYRDTLLELGDWHQLDDQRRAALRTYRELWRVLDTREPGTAVEPGIELLNTPAALKARPPAGHRVRRPPAEAGRYQKYTVDLDYTVTRDGRVKNITVTESNAPRAIEDNVARDLRLTRFRPRFLDGQPVDTAGLHHRQNFYDPRPATAITKLAAD